MSPTQTYTTRSPRSGRTYQVVVTSSTRHRSNAQVAKEPPRKGIFNVDWTPDKPRPPSRLHAFLDQVAGVLRGNKRLRRRGERDMERARKYQIALKEHRKRHPAPKRGLFSMFRKNKNAKGRPQRPALRSANSSRQGSSRQHSSRQGSSRKIYVTTSGRGATVHRVTRNR